MPVGLVRQMPACRPPPFRLGWGLQLLPGSLPSQGGPAPFKQPEAALPPLPAAAYLEGPLVVHSTIGVGKALDEDPVEPAFQNGREAKPMERKLEGKQGRAASGKQGRARGAPDPAPGLAGF